MSRVGGEGRPPGGGLDAGLPTVRPAAAELLDRAWRPVEALFNRAFGSRWNPLLKSGPLAVALLAIALLTGVYLFVLYRVAEPYESVARLDATWHGSLLRSLHRYSADLAVVAVAVHALKMLLAGRTWGPRALAWRSGVLLLGTVLLCGWTGLVMAWDVQGQWVAFEGARLLDLLPVFSEPITRSFVRPGAVGRAFFFTNLFLHVALPLGFATLFWLHASRVARPTMLPPRRMLIGVLAVLVATAIVVPVPLPPRADLLARPVDVPLDLFYAFWLPVARALPPWAHLAVWAVAGLVALSLPRWWRPRRHEPAPSWVDEQRCTGCSTCYEDCPFDAISMVVREPPSPLSLTVARVDPDLCVSCGICAGSCAPMGVGPPGRRGRDQLEQARRLVEGGAVRPGDVVVVSCRHALGGTDRLRRAVGPGVSIVESGCSGSVHTSSLELFLRAGGAGVLVLSCPGRDCLYREGPRWVEQRVHHGREAELQERVDRRRVRLVAFGCGETAAALEAIRRFRAELPESDVGIRRGDDLARECEVRDAYL